jgi:hypothetical protein
MADFINPVWNVFEPQVDDRSITEYSYVRYATTDGLNVSALNGDGQLYRIVTKDLDSYLLPSKALLDFTFKVTNNDADITPDLCQMHDNVLCIFSKMSLFLNSVPVCEVEHPVLTTTIKNLLEYSPDYKDTQGPAQFFYTSSEDFDATSDQAKRISGSKLVRVLIPLNRVFGTLEAYGSATRGLEIRCELVKENNTNIKRCIFGDALNTANKININEMSIWVPKLSPSQVAENHFLEIARNKDLNESISYEAWNGYRSSVVIGTSTSLNYQITSSSKKPKYVFVALQTIDRLEGSRTNPDEAFNPSLFDNLKLNNIALKVNSKRFPYEQYRLNYNNPTTTSATDYNRAYHDFLAILDQDSQLDSGSCVSHEEYASKYPIYAFDVSKDISLFENVQSNYIQVEMQFDAAIAGGSLYVNSVIVWDRALSMQSDGSALKITRD